MDQSLSPVRNFVGIDLAHRALHLAASCLRHPLHKLWGGVV